MLDAFERRCSLLRILEKRSGTLLVWPESEKLIDTADTK